MPNILSLDQLDPGIRRTVSWLRRLGFETTDSGDGVTKVAAGDDEALPIPHVFMVVPPAALLAEADRLHRFVADLPGARVEASYSPGEVGVIALLHVDDRKLLAVMSGG